MSTQITPEWIEYNRRLAAKGDGVAGAIVDLYDHAAHLAFGLRATLPVLARFDASAYREAQNRLAKWNAARQQAQEARS